MCGRASDGVRDVKCGQGDDSVRGVKREAHSGEVEKTQAKKRFRKIDRRIRSVFQHSKRLPLVNHLASY